MNDIPAFPSNITVDPEYMRAGRKMTYTFFLLGYYARRIKQTDAKGIILWYQDKCRIYMDEGAK